MEVCRNTLVNIMCYNHGFIHVWMFFHQQFWGIWATVPVLLKEHPCLTTSVLSLKVEYPEWKKILLGLISCLLFIAIDTLSNLFFIKILVPFSMF